MSKKKSTSPGAKKGFKHWFKGIKAEYKLIVWPKRDELVSSTIAVLVTSFVFGVIITSMDFVFGSLYQMFISLIS